MYALAVIVFTTAEGQGVLLQEFSGKPQIINKKMEGNIITIHVRPPPHHARPPCAEGPQPSAAI
jgi:hypothetical protein